MIENERSEWWHFFFFQYLMVRLVDARRVRTKVALEIDCLVSYRIEHNREMTRRKNRRKVTIFLLLSYDKYLSKIFVQ